MAQGTESPASNDSQATSSSLRWRVGYPFAVLVLLVSLGLVVSAWGNARARERKLAEAQFHDSAGNGAGFDAEHADQLFRPFQRLRIQGEFPGHGIGLASVKRINERHGGQIEACGAPGQGATFRFRLGAVVEPANPTN